MNLRRARPDEAPLLASIAYAAKAMWGYSPAQLALWAGELGPDAIHCEPSDLDRRVGRGGGGFLSTAHRWAIGAT